MTTPMTHADVDLIVSEARANATIPDLRGAVLSSADLRSADLRSADLRYADLRGADLSDADLRGANLRHANIWDADLRGADLRYADLRYADLWGANLSDADLRGANLRQPTNKAQERLSHALNLLDRATSIPAALSVDGEGGLFAEWIAGGVRLTVEVDKLGEIDWLVVKPHHDAVSVTLTDFFVLLRQLDAAIARAHAANH